VRIEVGRRDARLTSGVRLIARCDPDRVGEIDYDSFASVLLPADVYDLFPFPLRVL
jgi:hypothetical protein